jgi:hypothetical protein
MIARRPGGAPLPSNRHPKQDRFKNLSPEASQNDVGARYEWCALLVKFIGKCDRVDPETVSWRRK